MDLQPWGMRVPNCSPIAPHVPEDPWHAIGSILLNIFVCPVSCHVCYLFVLRDVLFRRLKGAKRHEHGSLTTDKHLELMRSLELSPKEQASAAMCGLWVYAFNIPQIFIVVLSSLNTELDADRACALALVILTAIFLVIENQIQRLRKDSTIN